MFDPGRSIERKMMARRNGAMPIIGIFAMMFALLPGTALAETTLRVWTPWPSYTTIFDKLTAEFHKTHPDVIVETTEMPEAEYRAAVKSALAANAGPDIITAVPGRTGMNFFADAGSITDLTPYYEKIPLGRLLSGMGPQRHHIHDEIGTKRDVGRSDPHSEPVPVLRSAGFQRT